MNANHPREALSAYLDGELQGEERLQLEEHLRRCPECTALLADLELLARAGADEEVPPLPADLSARIMTHIPRGMVERRRHWIHRMPLAAAASLAAVAVLWVVFQNAPSPLSDPELGRDIASRQNVPAPDKDAQPPQGATGGALGELEADEALRQEVKKSELNEKQEPFEYAPSEQDDAVAGKKEDAPAAVAPPPPSPEELRARKTKSLDRADARRQEESQLSYRRRAAIPPSTDSSREQVAAQEVVAESAREPEKVTARPPVSAMLDSVAKQSVAMEEEDRLVGADNVPASPPTLVLREMDQEIRLTETGLLSVHAADYDCTILLPPAAGDAEGVSRRSLALSSADSPSRIKNDEFFSLFQGEFTDTDGKRSAPRTQADDAAEEQPAPQWSVLLENAEGAEPKQSEGNAAGIRSQLRSLVWERYRRQLEMQCGPLPQPADGANRNP